MDEKSQIEFCKINEQIHDDINKLFTDKNYPLDNIISTLMIMCVQQIVYTKKLEKYDFTLFVNKVWDAVKESEKYEV